MIAEIKTQLYNILAEDLEYNVADNPYGQEVKSFPCVMLTLQDTTRDRRKDSYLFQIRFKIDIFSNYNGEKEILDMEQAIYDKSQKLLDNEYVTYYRESGFRIIDDKSTAEVRKHGIINYTVYCAGGIEDDTNEANG